MSGVIPPCKPSITGTLPSLGGVPFYSSRRREDESTAVRRDGFTLIELAIVLIVIALLSGGTLALLGRQIETAREITTRDHQQAVFEALQAFVLGAGRLPCPADGSIPTGSTNAGRESPQGGGPCTIDSAHAVVPWVTLAIAEPLSRDGWGRRFLYYPANGTIGARLTIPGDNGFRTDAGNLTIASDPGDLAGSTVTDQAAFVLLSHGENGDGGYLPSGNRTIGDPTGNGEDENQDGDRTFVDAGFSSDPATYHDDVILWRTKPALRFAAGAVFNSAQCTSAAALSAACDCEGLGTCALGSLDAADVCPAALAVLDHCGP